jgi:type IV fimbrial biogenesis protein FimT
MNTVKPARHVRSRGLTLLELAIAIAMLAILASLAVPTMAGRLDRQRLGTAAEALAADLNEARFEAARQGRTIHVRVLPGDNWCWAVATEPGCPCGQQQACELKRATVIEHPGLASVSGPSLQLSPQGQATQGGALTLRSARGASLRVELQLLGRARICADQAPVARYPAC